jgi:hypothetical protein
MINQYIEDSFTFYFRSDNELVPKGDLFFQKHNILTNEN